MCVCPPETPLITHKRARKIGIRKTSESSGFSVFLSSDERERRRRRRNISCASTHIHFSPSRERERERDEKERAERKKNYDTMMIITLPNAHIEANIFRACACVCVCARRTTNGPFFFLSSPC